MNNKTYIHITSSLHHFVTILVMFLVCTQPSFAFEDCLISTDAKLTEIRIEHNDIIDVCPIFTLMNEKNMLYLHPLKVGESKFSVLKGGKNKYTFSVKVDSEKTTIEDVDGFDILTVDTPPDVYEFELDEPPIRCGQWNK